MPTTRDLCEETRRRVCQLGRRPFAAFSFPEGYDLLAAFVNRERSLVRPSCAATLFIVPP